MKRFPTLYAKASSGARKNKVCTKCKVEKPLDQFGKKKSQCKQCDNTRVTKRILLRFATDPIYRAKFTLRVRKNMLQRKFGITLEDYDKLLQKQNNSCAICGSKIPKGRSTKYFSIDHDHKTGKVRGLLCWGCNSGLGKFCDDVNILKRAIAYIEKFRQEGV